MVTEVYDLETLSNLFTYTGYCLQDRTYYQFVIHGSNNQAEELYTHLKRDKVMMQVGFNNENFDYPILHYFLINYQKFKYFGGKELAEALYAKAQQVINSNEYTAIRDKDKIIPQTDLFLIWHYNNKARLTSLKDLEFAMQMPNIEEMPFEHSHWCQAQDIPSILSYNKNDVETTVKFLYTTLGITDYSVYKGKNKIELRDSLSNKFNLDCHNFPDVKIGEQLMLNLYSRAIKASPWDIKNLRTPRPTIELKDCIPTWCKIESKEFSRFVDILNNKVIHPGSANKKDKEFSESVIFHGISFDFGLGGTHGCIKAGVYDSDEDWAIYDMDVSSLYPSIAKSLGLYPAHLGPEFIELYSQFIDIRVAEKHKPKKERDNVLIEGYKLLLNGTYGKSGEETSFMYDLLYTYKTTIAGQIFIAMWAERMVKTVPELVFIQINTDGITIKVPREKISLIKEVYEQLTKETSLEIEDAYYKKMVIRDVNNYLAQDEKDLSYIKFKGCFEIDKEYHKDNSMRIVPIALKEYFINNQPIDNIIRNHKDIFDFCMRLKVNSSTNAYYNFINEEDRIESLKLSRTTRYFISNHGGSLTAYYNGSTNQSRFNVGFNCTLFNNFYQSNNYDINYQYYEIETRKIINAIEDNQLSLFLI